MKIRIKDHCDASKIRKNRTLMSETYFIWYRNFVIFCLWLVSFPAFAHTPVSCPASITVAGQKHNLAEIDVFDGPPEDMYNLMPDNSGGSSFWDTTFKYSSDGGFYVECIFDGTTVVQTIPIPHDVTKCVLGGSAKAEQIFCR